MKVGLVIILYLIGLGACYRKLKNVNFMDRIDQPVIGILTVPVSKYFKKRFGKDHKGLIPSSYKKWVEGTGARAVAVPHFATIKQIKNILGQINGLLLPGGNHELKKDGKPTEYMKKLEKIIKIAYQQNSENNKFPIWGTCNGFEALIHSFSDYKIKRIFINTENQSKKIIWDKNNYKDSLFEDVLRKEVAETMSKQPLSYFAQHFGFTTRAFCFVKSLMKNFKIIGYYKKNGKKIVSAVQHRFFPIVGVQFHPEKILYEHKLKVHTRLTKISAMASQELSRILFNSALENTNVFHDLDMLERLELKSFHSQKTMSVFESVYLFDSEYFKLKNLKKIASMVKVKVK